MSEQKFQAGDIVEAFGCRGEVVEVEEGDGLLDNYPVRVMLNMCNVERFTSDGLYFNWHKTPSLHFVERPKKKNVRVFKEWIDKEGVIRGTVVSDPEAKMVNGIIYLGFSDNFLMWTGREFSIEVEW